MFPVPVPPSHPALPAPPASAAEAVAAAERAFAADAVRLGTPAAFVAHFAPEGLVFTPHPENGRTVYGERKDNGSLLNWEPSYVEASASGDFAVSTGPWSWRAKEEKTPSSHGHFLTLWVRRKGRWQVRLDLGVPHPVQADEPLRLVAHPALGVPGEDPDGAWAAFDRQATRDLAESLRAAGAADLRLYRKDRAVLPGNLAALEGGEVGAVRWEPLGREVAASRDLAVRWGLRIRGGTRATALQVWRREAGGWRLAMDVALPHPAP